MSFYQFILALGFWQFVGVLALASIVLSVLGVVAHGLGKFRLINITHYHDGKKDGEK
jgi:hypothetical protein